MVAPPGERCSAPPLVPSPAIRAAARPEAAEALAAAAKALGEFPELIDLLDRARIDNPPVVIRDGGVIAPGFDEELDELRAIILLVSPLFLVYSCQVIETGCYIWMILS